MKINKLRFARFLVLLHLFFCSCGIEVGNPDKEESLANTPETGTFAEPPGNATVNFQGSLQADKATLSADSSSMNVVDTSGNIIGTIKLNEIKIAIKKITFILSTGEQIEVNLSSTSSGSGEAFLADLSPGSTSLDNPVSSPTLPYGDYNNIAITLMDLSRDGNDATNTISLVGTYSGDTSSGNETDIPFFLAYNTEETFALTSPGEMSLGFSIISTGANSIIIAFRLNKWFSFNNQSTNPDGVDFTSVAVTKDISDKTRIVLDNGASSLNKQISRVIVENIKKSIDYGTDSNGDGILGISEDDDPDGLDFNDF